MAARRGVAARELERGAVTERFLADHGGAARLDVDVNDLAGVTLRLRFGRFAGTHSRMRQVAEHRPVAGAIVACDPGAERLMLV